jgi:hypothetical protein
MPEKKPMTAAQARKKAKSAKEAKETEESTKSDAASKAAKATVRELLAFMEARARKEIARAVEEGDTSVFCYFGSWSWSDPRSGGSSMAAEKLAEVFRKEGYKVEVKCNSHYRHTDGDGCPTNYDEGSSTAAMDIEWGDDE